LRAALIKAGVTADGSGAAARMGEANTQPATAPEACRKDRLEIMGIAVSS
jgi:hypothetical protein